MDKSRPPALFAPGAAGTAMLAPGAASALTPRRFPGHNDRFPPVDEHISPPETPEEIVRGVRIELMGADAPHADPHSRLDYLLNAHVAPGYVASCDLKTRFTTGSNFAPDASIRKAGIDPSTQRRFLEDLAFEVVSTQHLTGKAGVTPKAEDMIERGVRRIFGLFVHEARIKEWRLGAWHPLPEDGTIEDICLSLPLPAAALLSAALADNAVAAALIKKKVPAIQKYVEEGRMEGQVQESRAAALELCEVLGIPITATRNDEIARLDLEGLRALRQHLRQQRRWPPA